MAMRDNIPFSYYLINVVQVSFSARNSLADAKNLQHKLHLRVLEVTAIVGESIHCRNFVVREQFVRQLKALYPNLVLTTISEGVQLRIKK
jgi:hypothetical protein